MIDWVGLFASYQVVVTHHEEIVQGILHPGLDPESPPVLAILQECCDSHFVHRTAAGTEVTLVRRIAPPRRERWGVHLLLFLLTLFTTTVSGAVFTGRTPLGFSPFAVGPWSVDLPVRVFLTELIPGLLFSIPLLVVLLAHEMGHYLAARWRRMDVSPPYFIPAPHFVNLIGTFGAFIRLRSPLINRAVLLEVGSAGPLASFMLSLPLVALGLGWSDALPPGPRVPAGYFIPTVDGLIPLGGSLVFDALAAAFARPGEVLLLHPFAVAGWLGLFVTMLNLFPIFQLDGGHVVYALLGGRQRWVGMAFLVLLVLLGNPWWGGWWGWWLWAALILLLGRGSVAHPRVFDPAYPLSPARRAVGWACVVILVLTFAPVPFPF